MFKGSLSAGICGRITALKIATALLLIVYSAFAAQAADPIRQSFVSEFGSSDSFPESGLFVNYERKFLGDELLFPDSAEKSATRAKALIIAPRILIDGERREFTARITSNEAIAYDWSFETHRKSKTPAIVEFSAPNAGTTLVAARWYARTGGSCSADFSSNYTIRLRVTLRDGCELLETFPLTVEVPHNWGGFVDYPETTGAPEISFDNERKIWIVAGAGTLERAVKEPVIRASETSQFYNKIKAHEEVHRRQMSEGAFADLFQIDSLMKQLSTLSGTARQNLEQQVFQTIQLWRKGETQTAFARLPKAEKEAYAVSDKIAPKYLFNNCERFK